MIRDMYSIRDLCVGFGTPFQMVNENVAKREFKNYLDTQKNPEDMQLYKIGTFNDETGTLTEIEPIFIMGGEKNV